MNSNRHLKPIARVARQQTHSAEHALAPALPAMAPPAYEELLHFFNQSPDLLCIADSHGRFKRLSPAWHTALGWAPAELQARPYLDLVHPDDRPATLAEMGKLDTGVPTVTFENRYRCKDGSWKCLQWTAIPVAERQEIHAIARDLTRQKQLEEEILDIRDRERERVGRELHDGLCQSLAGIAALSASLARRLAPIAALEAAAAREIGKLLGQSIGHARDLARGADPLHLEALGLVAALTDFCLTTEALFEITCTLECEFRPPKLGVKREAHLYRIAQEAVNNAIVHGRAQRIEVKLAYQNGEGTLAILDDGLGIGDPPVGHHGIGLRTMAYRARLIGASLELTRRSPRGTVATCVFSLLSPTLKP
ncbi:MAG: PAS domain S-box protein [Verrucomicrobia bacterium]|nr:PAS domain S-box protein [Verrucomicrobiota bacterium]